MKAKINYGMLTTITDFKEPEELEQEYIEFPNYLVTITKVDNEIKVSNVIDDQGNDVTKDFEVYTLNIKPL